MFSLKDMLKEIGGLEGEEKKEGFQGALKVSLVWPHRLNSLYTSLLEEHGESLKSLLWPLYFVAGGAWGKFKIFGVAPILRCWRSMGKV